MKEEEDQLSVSRTRVADPQIVGKKAKEKKIIQLLHNMLII